VYEAIEGSKNSHRFDPLSAFPAYIDAEYTMTPPFTLACQAIQAEDIAQSSFHRTTFDVYPLERSWTVDI
jgi:hypothetical protein